MQCEAFLKTFRPRSIVDYTKNERVKFSQIFEFVDLSDSSQNSLGESSLPKQTNATVETELFDQIEQIDRCAQAASTNSTVISFLPTEFTPIVSQSQAIVPCQSYSK